MPKNDLSERFEGTWNGEAVKSKRVWSGYRFTDDECERLLSGEEIEIEAVSSRTGKPFKCVGKLANLTYNGVSYVGFERVRFVNEGAGPGNPVPDGETPGPDGWCRYTFTDEERSDLLAGKTIRVIKKFIGQSGRAFSAEVRWNAATSSVEIVNFLK